MRTCRQKAVRGPWTCMGPQAVGCLPLACGGSCREEAQGLQPGGGDGVLSKAGAPDTAQAPWPLWKEHLDVCRPAAQTPVLCEAALL